MEVPNINLEKGDSFAGYRITEKLGPGVMGIVYLARDKQVVRRIALKILQPGLTQDKEYVEFFEEQAAAAKEIKHNNIAEFYDYGTEQGRLFAASEFIPGKTLAALIESQGRLDLQIALSLLITIGKALAHLHSAGIVHGGVNPGNIRMTKLGEIKLVDAGLAKKLVLLPQSTDEKPGITPVYLAPELVRRPPRIDYKADIYSLGITAFEALTGEIPFLCKSPHEMILRIMNEPLPRESMRSVPSDVVDLVSKMSAKNPYDRPADMNEVLEEMEKLAAKYAPVVVGAAPSESTQNAMDRRITRSRKKVFVYGICALIVAAIFLLFYLGGKETTTSDSGERHTVMQQAKEALEEAEKYERENPGNLLEAVERYRKVFNTFPKTSAAGEALIAERRLVYKLTEENVRKLTGSNRLFEATLVYDQFARHYEGTDESIRASDEKSRLLSTINEKFNYDMLEAARLTQKEKNKEAVALLEGVATYGTPELIEQSRSEIDRIKSSAGVVELEGPYAAAWEAVEPMLAIIAKQISERKYDDALASCDKFLSNPLPEGVEKIIEWEKEDINKLLEVKENFQDILGDAFKREEASTFTLADGTEIKGQVIKENDTYYLQISETGKLRLKPEDIIAEEVLKLTGMDVDEPNAVITSLLYHLHHGKARKAQALLKSASSLLNKETGIRYTNKTELILSIPMLDISRIQGKSNPRNIKHAAEIIEGARKLAKQEKWDQAYPLLKEAFRLNPVEAETLSLLGKCAKGKGLLYEAIGYYRKAISFNTQNLILWDELGKLYLQQGELGLGLAAFTQAAELNPSDPVAAQGRIEALIRLGEEEKARQVREEWEKNKP